MQRLRTLTAYVTWILSLTLGPNPGLQEPSTMSSLSWVSEQL